MLYSQIQKKTKSKKMKRSIIRNILIISQGIITIMIRPPLLAEGT